MAHDGADFPSNLVNLVGEVLATINQCNSISFKVFHIHQDLYMHTIMYMYEYNLLSKVFHSQIRIWLIRFLHFRHTTLPIHFLY